MKVLHLISGGDSGGAKTHVITLLKELQKDVSIELVCLAEGAFEREAKSATIPTTVMKQRSRFDLSVISQLANKINTEGFDLLHCHGARANFVAALLKKKISIPMLTTIHSDYRLDFSHNLYKKLVFTSLNRFGLNKMDYYLSVTEVFKSMLVEQGFNGSKIYTIYNGIHVISKVKDYTKLREHTPVFGCVTRLVPIKGTHILLEAVKECVDQGYNPTVRIAGMGEGGYVEKLHQFVTDNQLDKYVFFVGYVQDMDSFYETIDVNVLPSFTESFPYALLESGVRGIGTIASKAGGIIEMMENQETGLLFEVGNAKELAASMIALIENPDAVITYGLNFRHRVIDHFSDTAMAKRHIDIYSEILQKNGAAN